MKKIRFFCFLYFLVSGTLLGQDNVQEPKQAKNIFGISWGVVPGIMDMYIDMPYNYWPDQELSYLAQIFYARQVYESFRIGSYLEYEKADYTKKTGSGTSCLARYNLGINGLGQFPKTSLHLQLGGYFGYGFLMAPHWDNQKGVDLGLIIGPAYERNRFGIALHMQVGHGWYESSGTPEGVMLYSPRFLLKAYFKL